jgi:hypothetical protein
METLNELGKALVAAQMEMQNPAFDSQNPHFRSRFASLAAVRNAVIPTLAKHGIGVLQNLTTTETGVACETILLHSSGQVMRLGPLSMPATKPDAQGFGSAATYARRYALMAVAGVVGDDDDDANSATGKPAGAERIIPAKVQQAVKELRDTLSADVTEEARQDRVYNWHLAMNADQPTYLAVSDQLEPREKSALKAYVAAVREAKKAKPVQNNGRVAA